MRGAWRLNKAEWGQRDDYVNGTPEVETVVVNVHVVGKGRMDLDDGLVVWPEGVFHEDHLLPRWAAF